jgi:Holliday junction resolvasome RuvABC endonuclease subunit
MCVILALDAASNLTGWAVLRAVPKSLLGYGIIDLSKGKTLGDKLKALQEDFVNILIKYKPDYIVIEDIYLKNVKTLEVLSEVRGVLRLTAHPTQLKMIASSTMKSKIGLNIDMDVKSLLKSLKNKKLSKSAQASRMRTIKKQAIIRLVNNEFNISLNSKQDDIADAIALAYAYYMLLHF